MLNWTHDIEINNKKRPISYHYGGLKLIIAGNI